MYESVTVDEAIKKGHRMVTYPVIGIMFGIMILSVLAGIQKEMPVWVMFAGIIGSFVAAYVYWGFVITKWRLWAFDNVRNVHELEKRAIQEKLIWPEGTFYEKTEIRSSADKQRLEELKMKFSKEDVFNDDLSVSDEMIIYFATGKNMLQALTGLICIGAGVYMYYTSTNWIWCAVIIGFGVYNLIQNLRQASNKSPQIIINRDGIQTVKTPFYSWDKISNEESVSEGSGKHIKYYLNYNHPGGSENLLIYDYEVSQSELNKLLVLYRGRYNRKKRE